MSQSSEDETDISESELDEYVDRCYEQLRLDTQKVIYSDELYRCPYCPGKKKTVYAFKDLLRHASDVGKGSQNKDIKHKAKHLGLVRFMKTDINQPNDDLLLSSDFSGLAIETPVRNGVANDLFVWPWMGILANVDGESISKIKNDLIKKGFDPVRVRPLSTDGFAVVEFKKEWSGFYNAMMFEKAFEADKQGKKDYCDATSDATSYGWIAREDDYNLKGVLGEYLRRVGDLKTVGDVEAEEKRRTAMLIADLTETIDNLRHRLDELSCMDSKDERV